MIYENALALIGRTPMVRINKLVGPEDAAVWAKLEKMSVGGSVKDRLALYLIRDAEKRYPDIRSRVIIEATSGNTGIGLAMIGALKGYRVAIVMPESVSLERRQLIQAYGAQLILSPGARGTGGAIALKDELVAREPEKYVPLDQFGSEVNIQAHYETTARELLEDTGGRFDMAVIAVGTAGTGIGISRRLKEHDPSIRVVGVTPEMGTSIQGLRNPREENSSRIYDPRYFDEMVELSPEEIPSTHEYVRRLAREEGLLVGMSSGAAMYVARKKAQELGAGKTIVTLFADSGERYMSTELFA